MPLSALMPAPVNATSLNLPLFSAIAKIVVGNNPGNAQHPPARQLTTD